VPQTHSLKHIISGLYVFEVTSGLRKLIRTTIY